VAPLREPVADLYAQGHPQRRANGRDEDDINPLWRKSAGVVKDFTWQAPVGGQVTLKDLLVPLMQSVSDIQQQTGSQRERLSVFTGKIYRRVSVAALAIGT